VTLTEAKGCRQEEILTLVFFSLLIKQKKLCHSVNAFLSLEIPFLSLRMLKIMQ